MPIDTYALCPGGTEKKVKFCCPDLVGELQKIDRMIDGEQYVGCLKHVDQLLQQRPDRACLLAIKALLLRAGGQADEAHANAAFFLEKHPDNTTALAESAMATAAVEGGRAAVKLVQRAVALADGRLSPRVYEAIGAVAEVLLSEGEWLAGLATLQLQILANNKDQHALRLWMSVQRSPQIPLLFKDEFRFTPAPENVPWKARLEDALAPNRTGNWHAAADRLSALAGDVGDAPALWRNLAMLRGWLADDVGCITALRRFAALDVPMEDAVEAEALAMLMAEDPLGDAFDVLDVVWTVKDVERLQAGLTLDRRAAEAPFDRAALAQEDSPPPKAMYFLLSRPLPESAENLTIETVPRVIGQAFLFGRQTDREARFEVFDVTAHDLPAISALLAEAAGDACEPTPTQEVAGRLSASQELIRMKWRLPAGVTRPQVTSLIEQARRDALLSRWPDLKLGVLDGRSPRDAAQDPACRIRLAAAVTVLQSWDEANPDPYALNELRTALGLPILEPVDTDTVSIETLPLVRLSRVTAEKMPDGPLLVGFRRASSAAAVVALRRFAQVIVDRPTLVGRPEQTAALRLLAESSEDPKQAIEYIERGRQAVLAAGQSCASWDLLELPARLASGEGAELSRLIEHIERQHRNEPGVAEAFMQFLVQIGAIRPDGTPAIPAAAPAPLGPAAAAAEPEAGKLWVPGAPQGGGGGEKKLWTPG